jgi:hypothetical protein
MNEKAFQWLISSLVAMVIALVGLTYNNLRSQLNNIETKIETQTSRITRTNNRLNGVCERMALAEYQLNMRAGTCLTE